MGPKSHGYDTLYYNMPKKDAIEKEMKCEAVFIYSSLYVAI